MGPRHVADEVLEEERRGDRARAAFQETFTAGAAEAPGSTIVGSAPVLIEECDVVAVAEGWDGFRAAARY